MLVSGTVEPMRAAAPVLVILLGLALAGCATSFSPERVRSELASQTGADPQYVFEMQLGRVTMRLVQVALSGGGRSLPLVGLTEIDLAFYDVPEKGDSLDFTKMPVRGWEPVVRTRQPGSSAVVLVREGGSTISDLVLLGAGGKSAIYARLRGTLSPELPKALGEAFQSRGPDGLRDELLRDLTRQR
jgi:hypothetical protein